MTTVEELTQQVASLSKKNAELSSQVERLEDELADPPALRTCMGALATLEQENEALTRENEGIDQVPQRDYYSVVADNEMLRWQLETCEENLEEVKTEIAELKQHLEREGNTEDAVAGGGQRRKRRTRKRTKKK